MSDLDKKLGDSIVVGFLYGIKSDLLSDDEVNHRVAGFRHTQGYKKALSHAKQAFIDDGWEAPVEYDKPPKQMFGELVSLDSEYPISATFVGPDTYPLRSKRTPEELKAISEELSKPRLTGDEWYERFAKILEHNTEYYRKFTDEAKRFEQADVLEAAKEASNFYDTKHPIWIPTESEKKAGK